MGWLNGAARDCKSYEQNFCENGAAKPGFEFALGNVYNYPEDNCCACGKEKQTGICTISYWNKEMLDNRYNLI